MSFGALYKSLWSRHDVKMATKVNVYKEAVIPSLLYCTKCMTLYRYHIKKITRVQICHLRQLLRIKWEDRLPDVELLSRAGTISVEAQITSARLRWTGHITMPPRHLARELSYGDLCQ